MNVSWEAVGVVAGIFAMTTGANFAVVRYIVRDEIAKISGTYLRSNGSTLTGMEIERRLEALED